MAHLINYNRRNSTSLLEAVQKTVNELRGAYGTAVIDSDFPDEIIVARCGSPLVIGIGIGENFVASDQLALLPVTNKFVFLTSIISVKQNEFNSFFSFKSSILIS